MVSTIGFLCLWHPCVAYYICLDSSISNGNRILLLILCGIGHLLLVFYPCGISVAAAANRFLCVGMYNTNVIIVSVSSGNIITLWWCYCLSCSRQQDQSCRLVSATRAVMLPHWSCRCLGNYRNISGLWTQCHHCYSMTSTGMRSTKYYNLSS